MTKKWLGNQTACDLCKTPFTNMPWFADAKLVTRQWAIVCPTCFYANSISRDGNFGTGLAQKYDAKTKIKLEG